MDEIGNHVYNLFQNPYIYPMGRDPRRECVLFVPLNFVACQVHVNFAEDVEDKVECARACAVWIFENTQFRSISSLTPDYRKEARLFAMACGMKKAGVLPRAMQYNGEVHNMIIYQCSDLDYEEYKKWKAQ